MSFALSLLLLPYGFCLLIFFIFSFFNLYHLVKFGVANTVTLFMLSFYIVGSVLILSISLHFILQINWSNEISLILFSNQF